MALDFPSSPVNGQVYDNFYYDATKGIWKSIYSGSSPNYLVNPTITNAVITATATTPSTIPLTVNGAASQSANLQEWKNSAGIQLASINSSGHLTTNTVNTTGLNLSRQDTTAEGGQINFKRSTDDANSWYVDVYGSTATPNFRVVNNSYIPIDINYNGVVKFANQPAFSAYASAATLDATRTMPYNVATVNVGGYYNTSTYRFTAPVAGTYLFSIYDIGFAGYTTRFDLMKNGASQEDAGKAHQLRANNTSDYSTATSFWVISASAGDYFEVRIYAGRSHGTVEYSWFQGYLLG